MNYNRWIGLLGGLFLGICLGKAQVVVRLQKVDSVAIAGQSTYRAADTMAANAWLQTQLDSLQEAAYWEASLDEVVKTDSGWDVRLYQGPQYRWGEWLLKVPDSLGWGNTSWRAQAWRRQPATLASRNLILQTALTLAANRGYPFAEAQLDSLQAAKGILSGQVSLSPGLFQQFDSLQLGPDPPIGARFLYRYLGVAPGTPYRENAVLRMGDRLRELPYLQVKGEPEIVFREEGAQVALPLEARRASRFDFLIGVLPNSTQVNRLLLTGSFEGEFYNQFGQGERLYGRFEQLRPATQRLDLAVAYPYLLGTALGIDARFHLYKRDTTFLDLDSDAGVQYLLEGGNYWKVFWNNRASRLLSIDQTRLLATRSLPAQLDISNALFGLEWLQQQLDYRFNPRRGWLVFLRAAAGRRVIRPNSRILEIGLGELYDTLTLRSTQYRLLGRLEGYLPLGRQATVKGGVQGGSLLSAAPVYPNEQFRIGGNRLLRGFDEEFIFATHYLVGTLEYRLLLSQNSFLSAFGDYGWVEDRTVTQGDIFWPYGFGAGITLETRVGLFGVSLAFGGRPGSPVDFNAPKVHLGYVSLF
ncbi:MAG: BamA/TamA family outer membrane protein [Lewinellaceae bacterium]|nr:BamA/TamA family outer membrane protein [Lewinellaceae bacterium]